MGEALAALGTAGTALGLFSFFISVVDTLASALDKGSNARTRLELYEGRLKNCKLRFRLWEETWAGIDAQSVWSSQGKEVVYKRRETVLELQKALEEALYGHPIKRELKDIWSIWQRWLSSKILRKDLSQAQNSTANAVLAREDLHISIFKRVAMALYKDPILRERVEDLCAAVDDLESLTSIYNKLEHGLHEIDRRESEKFLRIQNRLRNIQEAMKIAYDEPDLHCQTMALMLPFSKRSIEDLLADREKLQLQLLNLGGNYDDQNQGHQLNVGYPLEPGPKDSMKVYIERAKDVLKARHEVRLSKDLKTELIELAQNTTHDWVDFETVTRSYRLELALCIAMWAVMGWHVHWTKDLCSCRIRQAEFGTGRKTPVFFHGSSKSRHQEYHCSADTLMHHPYLHIGTILAELALIRPVCARGDESGTGRIFCIWDYKIDDVGILRNGKLCKGLCRNVDESALAREAGLYMNWHAYRMAIQYCIALDNVTACQRQPEADRGVEEYSHAKILRSNIEFIFEPLLRYYDLLSEERQENPEDYTELEQELQNVISGSFFQKKK